MLADVTIRPAYPDERASVANVIDGAALEIDDDLLRTALETDDVLVAQSDESQILGAIVLDGEEVAAIAVRQRRRDQGIGRALVEAAAEDRTRLVAECNRDARPFWSSLGFEIVVTEDGRFLGVR
jgi:GNAT superfamily N-acetyltransferase